MRLHGTQKIISTEFRATKSRLRRVCFPGNRLQNRVLELAPIRASQNAHLKLVWPEIGTVSGLGLKGPLHGSRPRAAFPK